MDGIAGNTMPPCIQHVCDHAKKVAGTLKNASLISGILLGAFSVAMCGYTDQRYPGMESRMGLYMSLLLLLSNVILVHGIFAGKAAGLCVTLSINAVLTPTVPILIVVSLMNAGPEFPVGVAIGPCALVAVFLQSAVVYGFLLEIKGISKDTEKSSSHVSDYNMVADHKETWKGESDAIPAVFSLGKDAKQADSPGEKADVLCVTLSINAILIPTVPILIVISMTFGLPRFPVGAAIGTCALVAVFHQSAVVYGFLLEIKGISKDTEISNSHVSDYNMVAGHKETWKGESDAIPAIFSLGKDAKKAESPGV